MNLLLTNLIFVGAGNVAEQHRTDGQNLSGWGA
jgi:hypothetical protein